jgi:predicted nucleic acid-binding protein
MIPIGIDTSVLIGIIDPRDKWHKVAVDVYLALEKRDMVVVIFDCVLAEAITTITRRLQEQKRSSEFSGAVTRLSTTYPREDILWILPDVPELFTEIIGLIRSSQGELNFNDSLIALSCRNRSIRYLASFDRGFDQISWLKRIANPKDLDSITMD